MLRSPLAQLSDTFFQQFEFGRRNRQAPVLGPFKNFESFSEDRSPVAIGQLEDPFAPRFTGLPFFRSFFHQAGRSIEELLDDILIDFAPAAAETPDREESRELF
jgi:hypothetical protein